MWGLIQAIQDIGMEIGIEKCTMLLMQCRKSEIMQGIELPNQGRIRTFREKENYKYLGILETDTIKQAEMKEKGFKKEYLWRTRKQRKTKPCRRNIIKRINTLLVSLVRYSGLFLKWMREELQQIDQSTRKLMMMHKAKDDIDRLYISRKEGRRELVSIEGSIDTSIDDSKTT